MKRAGLFLVGIMFLLGAIVFNNLLIARLQARVAYLEERVKLQGGALDNHAQALGLAFHALSKIDTNWSVSVVDAAAYESNRLSPLKDGTIIPSRRPQ